MKRGFTLLEMLIVIGIIAALTAATLTGASRMLKAGENARAHELVVHAATALTALFDNDGVWPTAVREKSGQLLDADVAYCLKDHLSVEVDGSTKKSIGYDRFGIVTPWALAVIKRLGSQAGSGSKVNGSATIQEHILHYAVDLDGDGIIENVQIGGTGTQKKTTTKGISIRATAAVWCCDRDGNILDYETGVKKGGIYSWTYGQTLKVR